MNHYHVLHPPHTHSTLTPPLPPPPVTILTNYKNLLLLQIIHCSLHTFVWNCDSGALFGFLKCHPYPCQVTQMVEQHAMYTALTFLVLIIVQVRTTPRERPREEISYHLMNSAEILSLATNYKHPCMACTHIAYAQPFHIWSLCVCVCVLVRVSE